MSIPPQSRQPCRISESRGHLVKVTGLSSRKQYQLSSVHTQLFPDNSSAVLVTRQEKVLKELTQGWTWVLVEVGDMMKSEFRFLSPISLFFSDSLTGKCEKLRKLFWPLGLCFPKVK